MQRVGIDHHLCIDHHLSKIIIHPDSIKHQIKASLTVCRASDIWRPAFLVSSPPSASMSTWAPLSEGEQTNKQCLNRFLSPREVASSIAISFVCCLRRFSHAPEIDKLFMINLINGGQETVVDESQKSQFEKRKRNLKAISPISRGEREI